MNEIEIDGLGYDPARHSLRDRCDPVWYRQCAVCGIESAVTVESSLHGWTIEAWTRCNGESEWKRIDWSAFCVTRFGRWMEVATTKWALHIADRDCHRRLVPVGETT